MTAEETDGVNPGARSSIYATKKTAMDMEIASPTSSVRSKDPSLVSDKSQLVYSAATFTKHTNDIFSSICVNIYSMQASSISSVTPTSTISTIW